MKYRVKFYWFKSYKIWDVYASNTDELLRKCEQLCVKYHALHSEVLDN